MFYLFIPNLYENSGIKKGLTNAISLSILFLLTLSIQPTLPVLVIRLFKVDFIPNFESKTALKNSTSS
jgi:hypothetical protein